MSNEQHDYLDEDYVPGHHKYAVVSYFQNTKDNQDTVFGQYKIKGIFKDMKIAQKAIDRYSKDAKKFNIYIVECGKWNGLYTDEGIMQLQSKTDNIVQSNELLNNIMKEKKESFKQSEEEHKKRIEVNRQMMSVQTSLTRGLQLLERLKFISVKRGSQDEQIDEERVRGETRSKLRKNPKELEEFLKKCTQEDFEAVEFLRPIEDMHSSITKTHVQDLIDGSSLDVASKTDEYNLKSLYESIQDPQTEKPHTDIRDLVNAMYRDIHNYRNYTENYQESLRLNKQDLQAQMRDLQEQIDRIDDTVQENNFNTEQIFKIKPIEYM